MVLSIPWLKFVIVVTALMHKQKCKSFYSLNNTLKVIFEIRNKTDDIFWVKYNSAQSNQLFGHIR